MFLQHYHSAKGYFMLDTNTILQLSNGIDEHLRKLEGMIGVLREIKASLDEQRHAREDQYAYEQKQLRREIEDLTGTLRRYGLPQYNQYERKLNEVREMIDNPTYPIAVDPDCMCTTEEMAQECAEGIIFQLVIDNLQGKKFLDYGCGAGHVVKEASRNEAIAVGYDINQSFKSEQILCHFNEVVEKGPYDVILMNDVLDHIVSIDPIQALQQAKRVLAPNGKIIVHNHPWCSRHGGHLYLQKNKAFLHLVLDEIELARSHGINSEPIQRITTPLETYAYWFKEAGLKVESEYTKINKVERIFLDPSPLHDRIKSRWNNEENIEKHMEISFVDYVLRSEHQVF